MSEAGTRYTVETDGMLFAEPSPQEAAAVACDDEFRPGVFPGLAISLPILFA